MNDDNLQNVIETLLSLNLAIIASGGTCGYVTIENLQKITAYDLILHISGNGIRFEKQS